jgi:hypothetical protein
VNASSLLSSTAAPYSNETAHAQWLSHELLVSKPNSFTHSGDNSFSIKRETWCEKQLQQPKLLLLLLTKQVRSLADRS